MNTNIENTDQLSTYVSMINDLLSNARQTSKKIFHTLKEARKTLVAEDYARLKKLIDMDKSTINKIEKIFANEFLMDNLDRFPNSWGTLYELASFKDDDLERLIIEKKVTVNSTRSDVQKLKQKQTEEPSASADLTEEEESVAKSDDQGQGTFTLTIKPEASTHKKEIKALVDQLQNYFDIPEDMLKFLTEELA